MKKIFLKCFILVGILLSPLYGHGNKEYLGDHEVTETNQENKWKIGGKIHFEEKSSSDYLGTIEINKITRKVFKDYFNIKSDSCAFNAKVLIKKENDEYVLKHYEEKNNPGIGEEMHATLLYTNKRIANGHETLNDIYHNLKQVDNDLPDSRTPTVEEIAQAYNKIIKPDWKFEICDVIFVKGKTGSCIIAKLLYEGRDEIVNKKEDPISGNFLHISLVNVDPSIVSEVEKIDLVVSKLKEKLLNKRIKVGNQNGVADLEFGITGSTPKERIRPIPSNIKINVVYIPQNDNKSCATTSIAMAISYYENLKKPLDKEFIWKLSGIDENNVYQYGNDMEGLKNITEYYSYKSEFFENMNISDIEYLLSKGVLVIPTITVDNKTLATHSVLVIGYDKDEKILHINDPANKQNKILKYSDFETKWSSAYLSSPRKKAYRSAFVIYPKN
ncbi:MAG: hypothetical protein KR126chlam6_01416 [Candidatus Anoxychlamydiales bacterium]|nr:hypothetical protein [Candidatus Anoxychlamydiales bacterium]